MVTAYDYPFGLMAAEAGVDIVLVGDSLGMVVMGLDGTVAVTMAHMIHHVRAVVRGCNGPLIIGDMPFMSYNTSVREAIHNAGRLMKEGGCDAIKLEGGVDFAPTVKSIVKAGIPVQGHIGLTPQTASALGGFKMQGRDAAAAKRIIEDARALEDAGVFSIILEAVPAPLGKLVAESVQVPVIGIGAGVDVDGQVLVTHDMVGLFDTCLEGVGQRVVIGKVCCKLLHIRFRRIVSFDTATDQMPSVIPQGARRREVLFGGDILPDRNGLQFGIDSGKPLGNHGPVFFEAVHLPCRCRELFFKPIDALPGRPDDAPRPRRARRGCAATRPAPAREPAARAGARRATAPRKHPGPPCSSRGRPSSSTARCRRPPRPVRAS